MKTWLSLLLILFFSVIFPLSAVPADLVSPQLASPQLFSIEFNNVYSNKNLTQKKSEYNAEILTNAKQDLEGLFAPQLFRPMASLFQARVQTDPEYLLKINFSPQTLVLRLFNLSFYQSKFIPWFLQTSSSNNCRLSSWKDGNSLYTAKITYS